MRPRPLSLRPALERLCLLGGFVLERDECCAPLPPQVQKLVAFLALQGRPLHRAYVAGRLWLDYDQEHAHGCLRTTLWRLSLVPFSVVDTTSTHLALHQSVSVDVRDLEACARHVLSTDALPDKTVVDRLAEGGELLPDWYDDWIPQERERLRQLRLLALESAGEQLVAARRYTEGSLAALAAVRADPLRESAYRLLIRSYLGVGNVAEALRQFGLFRSRLKLELGLEPSSEIRKMLADVA